MRKPAIRRAWARVHVAALTALLALSALMIAPRNAQGDEVLIWSATLRLARIQTPNSSPNFGYNPYLITETVDDQGDLTPNTFRYRAATIGCFRLAYNNHSLGHLEFFINHDSGPLPDDGLLGDRELKLHFSVSPRDTGRSFSQPKGRLQPVLPQKAACGPPRPQNGLSPCKVPFPGRRTALAASGRRRRACPLKAGYLRGPRSAANTPKTVSRPSSVVAPKVPPARAGACPLVPKNCPPQRP